MKLSVAIVVHRSDLGEVGCCLESIAEALTVLVATEPCQAVVSLVDNSLDEAYSKRLDHIVTELKLPVGSYLKHRVLDENQVYGSANNVLLNSLDSTYHLVLNPDVVLDKDALLECMDFMRENPDVALLSPRIREPNKTYSHVIKSYPSCFALFLRYLASARLLRTFGSYLDKYSRKDLDGSVASDVALVGGCFMFMKTLDFKSIGGFDHRFFLYFEDFDLSVRLRTLGRISYVPSVLITHSGGDVGRKAFRHHRFFIMSAVRFFNKYGWKLC